MSKKSLTNLNQKEKILLSSLRVNNFLTHISSISEIYTKYYSELAILKTKLVDKQIKKNNFHQEKTKLKQQRNNKINNLKFLYKEFHTLYKHLKHRFSNDNEHLKILNDNFIFIKESILYRGGKNRKYFSHDIQEYERMNNKPILFVRNLTKYYFKKKIPNIDSLNFEVYPGEFHAFIGANGAGKTTTIKCLITSYFNWSGTILIKGIKNWLESAKTKIGYIPEKAVFPEGFTTFDYLKWMVMLSGIKEKEAKKITENQLKSIGMWNMRHREPNSFSSGQKKKVLLSQTLIHNPDIIIMDEPVANLDPKARIDFFDTLLELKKQQKAIFISSHVLAELDMYADSLTILDGGKIIYSGKKEKLLKKYDTKKYFLSIAHKNANVIEAYLNRNKFKFNSNRTEESIQYEVKFKSKQDPEKMLKYLSSKKVYFTSFYKIKPSLEDIYRKLIILGSKDTMAENVANNRTEGLTKVSHFNKIY